MRQQPAALRSDPGLSIGGTLQECRFSPRTANTTRRKHSGQLPSSAAGSLVSPSSSPRCSSEKRCWGVMGKALPSPSGPPGSAASSTCSKLLRRAAAGVSFLPVASVWEPAAAGAWTAATCAGALQASAGPAAKASPHPRPAPAAQVPPLLGRRLPHRRQRVEARPRGAAHRVAPPLPARVADCQVCPAGGKESHSKRCMQGSAEHRRTSIPKLTCQCTANSCRPAARMAEHS